MYATVVVSMCSLDIKVSRIRAISYHALLPCRSGMGKLQPEGWMWPLWPFNPARHTCPNYIIIILVIFPCNARISPIDDVEKAKTIFSILDFYISFIFVHTIALSNFGTHCDPRVIQSWLTPGVGSQLSRSSFPE